MKKNKTKNSLIIIGVLTVALLVGGVGMMRIAEGAYDCFEGDVYFNNVSEWDYDCRKCDDPYHSCYYGGHYWYACGGDCACYNGWQSDFVWTTPDVCSANKCTDLEAGADYTHLGAYIPTNCATAVVPYWKAVCGYEATYIGTRNQANLYGWNLIQIHTGRLWHAQLLWQSNSESGLTGADGVCSCPISS